MQIPVLTGIFYAFDQSYIDFVKSITDIVKNQL